MKNIFITMIFIGSTAVAQGNGAGNGGNIAVCFKSPLTKKRVVAQGNQMSDIDVKDIQWIEALDLYLASAQFPPGSNLNNELVLPGANETQEKYVERIAQRFKYALPSLYLEILKHAKTFSRNRFTHYTKGGLDRIDDAGERYYLDPLRCILVTSIRQTRNLDSTYLEFDARLFSPMTSNAIHSMKSQKILFLHEVIYHWGIGLGHRDSSNTQKLIAILLKKDLQRSDVLRALRDFGFRKCGGECAEESPELKVLESLRREIKGKFLNASEYAVKIKRFLDRDLKKETEKLELPSTDYISLLQACQTNSAHCIGFDEDSLNQIFKLREWVERWEKMYSEDMQTVRVLPYRFRSQSDEDKQVAARNAASNSNRSYESGIAEANKELVNYLKSLSRLAQGNIDAFQNWRDGTANALYARFISEAMNNPSLDWLDPRFKALILERLNCEKDFWLQLSTSCSPMSDAEFDREAIASRENIPAGGAE